MVGPLVHVDLRDPQIRILVADRAQQSAQSGLFQVGPVVGDDGLRVAGRHEQPRWRAAAFGQPPDDADQMMHVVAAPQRALVVRVAVLRAGEHDHAAELAATKVLGELARRSTQ